MSEVGKGQESRLRIVAWNLKHRCTHAAIAPDLPDAIAALAPSLLFFSEYVEYPDQRPEKCLDRHWLRERLAGLGLPHHCLSPGAERSTRTFENRVAAFSCHRLEPGALAPPEYPFGPGGPMDEGHRTNFLSLRLPDLGLEVVGLRAPWYGGRDSVFKAYWASLLERLEGHSAERLAVVGDMNLDIHLPEAQEEKAWRNWVKRRLRSLGSAERPWTAPVPEPGGSHVDGGRIDHALLRGLSCVRARYVESLGAIRCMGARPRAISDHAPLVLDVEWA